MGRVPWMVLMPPIPGTLQVHQVIRKKNNQGVWYLQFYKLSSMKSLFMLNIKGKSMTQWSVDTKIMMAVRIVVQNAIKLIFRAKNGSSVLYPNTGIVENNVLKCKIRVYLFD